MTVLQLLDSYIDKYEELQGIADTNLQEGYSKGWYAEYHQSKNKLAVLKELKDELVKNNSNSNLPLGKRKMYVLYGHDDIPIACVNPDTVTLIEVADYWGKPVKFYSRIRYQEYNNIEEESIRFFATRAYFRVVDLEILQRANPDMIVWTSIPTVESWDEAWEMRRTIENKFQKIFTK